MTNDTDYPQRTDGRQGRRRWPWLLLALLFAFAGGIAGTVWTLHRSQPIRRFAGLDAVVIAPARVTSPRPVANPAASAPPAPDLVRRIDRMERGMAQLSERANETSSNADRAEGLLVAFAARRALDRGAPLGYIEGLLRERFGGTQPQTVATILSAARQPVTLEELQTRLDAVAPQLVASGGDEGWWQGVRRELSGLVVVRRASQPSIAPADRLSRARRQLEAGHVDLALAEVARLPGRDRAADWIVLARRYASARHALDLIETAALLAPHARPDAAPLRATTSAPIQVPVSETG